MKKITILSFTLLGLLYLKPFPISAQTLDERKQIVEYLRQQINPGESTEWKSLFSFAYYADYEKAFYMEVGRTNSTSPAKYVIRYDIRNGTSTIFVPLPWQRGVSQHKIQYDCPIQRALFEEENQYILMEMDFQKETWKPLFYFPKEFKFDRLEDIPGTSRMAFSYSLNGFDHYSGRFGLECLDWKTGERKTVLEQTTYQNSMVSSCPQLLPYEFLNENILLYIETINPYHTQETDTIHQILTADRDTFNVLWHLNLISGKKIQMATSKLSLSVPHFLQENRIHWNGADIGSVTDVLQIK